MEKKAKKTKILLYNWAPFDEGRTGGGVSVYLKNLIEEMAKNNFEVYFLCSGTDYSPQTDSPFIVRYKNCFGNKCKTYRIVNSPIPAPAFYSFRMMETYLNDKQLLKIISVFLKKHGPFDVMHFHGLEGLSLGVLRIKRKFPEMKVFYTVHNYYAFCPQVNFWCGDEKNCLLQNERDCKKCIPSETDIRKMYIRYSWNYLMRNINIKPGSKLYEPIDYLIRKHLRIASLLAKPGRHLNGLWSELPSEDSYRDFHNKNITFINQYFDKVLAVSERVREIAIAEGVNKEKVTVSYIGSKMADNSIEKEPKDTDDYFNVIYMGYARKDKGFFFLIDALSNLDYEIAKRINLYFAINSDKRTEKDILNALGKRFHRIYIKDTYTHEELPEILKKMHLGIIPNLWEDNLPQVAIELIANGVPILCSDSGGTKELVGDSGDYVFCRNNVDDFLIKLENLEKHREKLLIFLDTVKPLLSMKQHREVLKDIYENT